MPSVFAPSSHTAATHRFLGWGWSAGMLLAGELQAMSLAWPGSGQALWWLQLLSLAALATGLLHAPTARSAAWRGFVFATAWLAGTFWWLFISMHTYGGLPAPLAVLAVLALAAFLGAYYAIAAWGFVRLRPMQPAWAALVFAACWTLAELARGTLWTGFPWGAAGYAHVDGPLAALPRWVGVYGTGAVAAWSAMLLAQMLATPARRALRWAAPLVLTAGAVAGLGVWQQRALAEGDAQALAEGRPVLDVALLQGNIPQDVKFEPGEGIALSLNWYGRQLLQPAAPLVVAPETAIPLLPRQLPEGYLDAVTAPYRYQEAGTGAHAALVGMPLGDEEHGYANAVVGWQPGAGSSYRYDKHHLVPFGEFIPPLFHWFVRMMHIPLGDFARGAVAQPPMLWQGERLAPNICYEDLFGEELGARFADPAQAPTVFVNISNIGWFGDSPAIDQHLHISRMRSLEFERPMLRATNTGATVAIDHRGVVTHQLPAFERGVLLATTQGREHLTPYARWVAAAGLWPLGLLCAAVLALAGWLLRRSK
ncbi:apolipoprotein N-acyltransferase [Comamonas sp. CMM03]|jgi:apolipoprotein N-acyltransferase|nr:apolipoprotein N-acyltransferase [Comamonas sp. CMM03]